MSFQGSKSADRLIESIDRLIPADHPLFSAVERKLDRVLDNYGAGVKPFIPALGRFLIVATFFEDSLRIVSQWKEQVYYLATFRHLYEFVVKFFLFGIIVGMITGASLVVLRKQALLASGLLSGIVLLQGVVYGLLFDFSFLLRNVSVIGGLLLALSDSLVIDKRSLSMAGVPMLESKDYNKKYFLLAGRIMLLVLFLSFSLSLSFSFFSIPLVLIGFLSCLSIAIGYKTRLAASVLTLMLTVHNCITNHYWTYGIKDSRRDYLRYEFFQTLSIVGGLLLVVNTGAGELSVDEKKKKY